MTVPQVTLPVEEQEKVDESPPFRFVWTLNWTGEPEAISPFGVTETLLLGGLVTGMTHHP